jgi:hypothetical protein
MITARTAKATRKGQQGTVAIPRRKDHIDGPFGALLSLLLLGSKYLTHGRDQRVGSKRLLK